MVYNIGKWWLRRKKMRKNGEVEMREAEIKEVEDERKCGKAGEKRQRKSFKKREKQKVK